MHRAAIAANKMHNSYILIQKKMSYEYSKEAVASKEEPKQYKLYIIRVGDSLKIQYRHLKNQVAR